MLSLNSKRSEARSKYSCVVSIARMGAVSGR
jgi:hypothetical protein